MYQSPLFQLDDLNEAQTLIWSKSRREVFEQCLRRYYYTYYGSHAHHAKDDPQKATLKRLKSLTGLTLRAGDLLHKAIKWVLEGQRDGRPVSLNSSLEWVRSAFERDLQDVGRGDLEAEVRGRMQFVEFFYGQVGAMDKARLEIERLNTSLTAFFTDPKFSRYRFLAGSSALIEKRLRVRSGEAEISGKLDFAYWEGEWFHIVDWKIGKVGGAEEDLQLLVYSFLASEELNLDPGRIQSARVHLTEGVRVEQEPDPTLLRRARARVQQDLERMQAMHGYGHGGIVEVFTPRAEPKICALCAFQQVCPKE